MWGPPEAHTCPSSGGTCRSPMMITTTWTCKTAPRAPTQLPPSYPAFLPPRPQPQPLLSFYHSALIPDP